MRNPMLREEPRYEKAQVLPLTNQENILQWLQSKGRVVARQTIETPVVEEEEEEIEDLMDDDGEDLFDADED